MQAICTAVGYLPALVIQWSVPEDEGVAIGAAPVAALGILVMTGVGGSIGVRWLGARLWPQVGWGSALGAFLAVAVLATVVAVVGGMGWVLLAAAPSMVAAGLLGMGGGTIGARLASGRRRL